MTTGDNIETNNVVESLSSNEKPMKPCLGMKFSSIQEAEDYYQDYGRGMGFVIRKRSSYVTKHRFVINRLMFTCSCEGIHKINLDFGDGISKKMSTSTKKTDCKTRMRIALDAKQESWFVNDYIDEHNHEMVTPSKRILMRSNKYMPNAAKSLAEVFNEERLQVGKVASIFGGSSSNVGFTSRDVYNHLRTVRKSTLEVGDAEAMMCYFRRMTIENPNFYYVAQHDDEGRAANFFWVDARSRMAYSRFGDIVVFDTTYKTNKYSMPFAPFTGVNHHEQSILFGLALLQDETEETFTWLFETWLEAMEGKYPVSILTDQDMAMTNAIKKVFPNTRHRFCLWHIKKKFAEKLSHVFFEKSEFKRRVKQVTRNTYTVEDFEEQWQSMLVEFDLVGHVWLNHLYTLREKWIPVFNQGTFFAGMNTTQRSESMNAFFDYFVNTKSSLRDFVLNCDKAVDRIYNREREEDFKSIHKHRIFSSEDLLIKQAAKIFTRAIFDKVHYQFNVSMRFRSELHTRDGDEFTFKVSSKTGPKEEFLVRMHQVTKEGVCGCQLFDFKGIPCRHLHHVLVLRFYVEEIPTHFILKRWMKDANRSEVVCANGLVMRANNAGSEALRISHYCRRSTELAYIMGKSEQAYNVAMDLLNQAFEKVLQIEKDELQQEHADITLDGNFVSAAVSASEQTMGNPRVTKTKGRKLDSKGKEAIVTTAISDVRYKSSLEMSQAKKRPRACKTCKVQGHDSRNCKKRKDQHLSVDKHLSVGIDEAVPQILLIGGYQIGGYQVKDKFYKQLRIKFVIAAKSTQDCRKMD